MKTVDYLLMEGVSQASHAEALKYHGGRAEVRRELDEEFG